MGCSLERPLLVLEVCRPGIGTRELSCRIPQGKGVRPPGDHEPASPA